MAAALKLEQERVKILLCDTVTMLCKNGLPFSKTLRIQGLLGVTIDDHDILLVQIGECFENTDGGDGGAVNCADSTNDQTSGLEVSRVAVKLTHGGSKHSPLAISPRMRAVIAPPPPPPNRGNSGMSNNTRVKRKQQPVKWSPNISHVKSSCRIENKLDADVKPDFVIIKTECSTVQPAEDEEDCEIIDTVANDSGDYNCETAIPIYQSTTDNSILNVPNRQSSNFASVKREIKNEISSNEMVYDETGERHSSEGFVNDEEGEWHDGDRSDLIESYGEYDSGNWQDQSGGNYEDGYEGAESSQAFGACHQPVLRAMLKKGVPAKRSRPLVRNPTAATPGRFEGGAIKDFCVTKSLHECAYPDCGKQFRHKQHLLRHQTQKHNRAPKKVLTYSKHWVSNDDVQLQQLTEFADAGGGYQC